MRRRIRINRTLILIENLWEKYPDQRLGQLLTNFAFKEDSFYQEDHETELNILRELKWNNN